MNSLILGKIRISIGSIFLTPIINWRHFLNLKHMKITIIGTGNIAYHLSQRWQQQGVTIAQIVGRDVEKVRELADLLQTNGTTDYDKVLTTSDVYIIAVTDMAIIDIAMRLSYILKDKLIIHTSGTMPSNILEPFSTQFGVMWPLQTFSKNTPLDFERIPIFINANQNTPPQYSQHFLRQLAERISKNVYELPDKDRLTLHVAAVFVNNFANHLFKIGSEILKKQELPFDILHPLIEETVRKIQDNLPETTQTGPAIRADNQTIEKHLTYLQQHHPQYDLIYMLMSISINQHLKINKPI